MANYNSVSWTQTLLLFLFVASQVQIEVNNNKASSWYIITVNSKLQALCLYCNSIIEAQWLYYRTHMYDNVFYICAKFRLSRGCAPIEGCGCILEFTVYDF